MSLHRGFTRAASSIANDVRIRRSSFAGAILLVEGGADARALGGFVDPQTCVVVVADTRWNVEEVVRTSRAEGISGVVGLVDADFGHITGRLSGDPDIVTTDLHDLETTFLRSEAFERVLAFHGSPAKLADARARYGIDLRPLVLGPAMRAGALRLHSERHSLGWSFEGLAWRKIVARRTFTMDDVALCREVMNKSQQHRLDPSEMVADMVEVLGESHDTWQLCNGHDVIEAFAMALRGVLGSQGPSSLTPDRVAMELAITYPQSAFDSSSMASDLRSWETRNAPFRVLP